METGLFDIQADYLREFRQSRQGKPLSREFVYALFGRLTRSVSIRHRTPSPTKRRPYRVQGLFLSNLPSIAPLTSRVAFCVSPICPTSRSIASAASSGRGRVRVRRRRGTTAERSADRPAHRGLPQTP